MPLHNISVVSCISSQRARPSPSEPCQSGELAAGPVCDTQWREGPQTVRASCTALGCVYVQAASVPSTGWDTRGGTLRCRVAAGWQQLQRGSVRGASIGPHAAGARAGHRPTPLWGPGRPSSPVATSHQSSICPGRLTSCGGATAAGTDHHRALPPTLRPPSGPVISRALAEAGQR